MVLCYIKVRTADTGLNQSTGSGTPTKYGSLCRAFKYCGGNTVSLDYMNSFCERLQCNPITLLYGRDGDVDKTPIIPIILYCAKYSEEYFQTSQKKCIKALMEEIAQSQQTFLSGDTSEISQCSQVFAASASDDDSYPEMICETGRSGTGQ